MNEDELVMAENFASTDFPPGVGRSWVGSLVGEVRRLQEELRLAELAIHDLQEESAAYRLGVRDERRQTREMIDASVEVLLALAASDTGEDYVAAYRAKVNCLQGLARNLGQVSEGPGLPPDRLRAKLAQWRLVMRQVDQLFRLAAGGSDGRQLYALLKEAHDAVRKPLSEADY